MVLVIGATGFIGVYLVDALRNAGYEVLATGRSHAADNFFRSRNVQLIDLNIENKEEFDDLPKKDVEGVILLAGLLPANAETDIDRDENADRYIGINTIGTINVLEYCRKNNIKKIISTTSYSDVFNSWKKGVALTEDEPRGFKFTGDHATYVISKNAATDMIEYYNEQHGLQGAVFRLPPVYGVGPHSEIYVNGKYYKTGIQTFIEKAQSGQDIEIWGDPSTSRDLVYVKDVARAFILALGSDKTHGLYNMTSGTAVTLEEQVRTVIDVFSKGENKSKIVYRPDKKNNTPSYLFDMSKAKRDFGFVPEYKSYKKMMIDYKKEMDSGRFNFLIESRRKDK
jgi:UDP-glucose 4-epimerase